MLGSYLDESSDQKKKEALCVGGILINDTCLSQIQDAWIAGLKIAGISYFHFTECKGLHGEFFHYRAKYKSEAKNVAGNILANFEDILLSTSWIGFGLGIVIQDYLGVLREFPGVSIFYSRDPTDFAYGQIMYEIAKAVRKNARGWQAAFFIDESSDYPKISDTFRGVKTNHPIIGKTMATVAPLNDKKTPALQMADLLVGNIKESFIKALRIGKEYGSLDDKWKNHIELIGICNKSHMLKNIKTNLLSPRLLAGKIATRQPPKLSGTNIRRQEKNRRRCLVKEKHSKVS
jgi:hypothetical protein